jgi:hypothetical protein
LLGPELDDRTGKAVIACDHPTQAVFASDEGAHLEAGNSTGAEGDCADWNALNDREEVVVLIVRLLELP